MATSRLRLDFKLQTAIERMEFLNNYLNSPQFIKNPPTSEELETMSNYVLWGKNANGLNVKQEKLIELESKHKTWDSARDVESLEGLMESPAFNEASVHGVGSVPTKVKKEIFPRSETLRECPEDLAPIFRNLFRSIDELDLIINFYDLAHGKRKTPIRDNLLNRFAPAEQEALRVRADILNQFSYLKLRHLLVELRREQYTLRDSYAQSVFTKDQHLPITPGETRIGMEIEVLPLGLWDTKGVAKMVFAPTANLVPKAYDEADLRKISDLIWAKQDAHRAKRYFDFRELEHVYNFFELWYELRDDSDAAEAASRESALPQFLRTLEYYIEMADLTEVQKDVLDMKIRKVCNVDIAREVNAKWGKNYTANYISTIFRQRIIPRINNAAKLHERIVGALFFEEEFKACSKCGQILLRDPDNFTRKSRSKDGYVSRCKKCEKEARSC